jgi:osmotically-inducible protein OsmY
MKLLQFLAAAGVLGALAGCTPQGRSAYQNADQSSSGKAEKILGAAKIDANATVGDLKKDAGSSKSSFADEEMALKVKSALGSADGLDTSKLTVNHTGKLITLTGSVPTASEKKQADKIASGITGSTYQLKDKLTVASK